MERYVRVVLNDSLETEFLFKKENHNAKFQKTPNESYLRVTNKDFKDVLLVPYKNVKFVDFEYCIEEDDEEECYEDE